MKPNFIKPFLFLTCLFIIALSANYALAAPCHELDSSVSIPAGYGASYDIFSPNKDATITADCADNTDSVFFNIGSGKNTQYIYKKGYLYRDNNWEEISFFPSGGTAFTNWHIGRSKINLTFNPGELDSGGYILAYVCDLKNGQWKCGCRDGSCAQSFWQMQRFKRWGSACRDKDNDGYGNPASNTCVRPELDCADNVNYINPGAAEICGNTIDENCDGIDDICPNTCNDIDKDSFDTCSIGENGDDGKPLDCDDSDYWINPNRGEICDARDNDCDKTIDNGCDDDLDKFCDRSMIIRGTNSTCPRSSFSGGDILGDDCDDTNDNINPGKPEICGNTIDDNCNKQVDENCDTKNPVVTAFDVNPKNTSGSVTAAWSVIDNISLDRVELWRADYNSVSCATGFEPGCSWSQIGNSQSVTGKSAKSNILPNTLFSDAPAIGAYWYGIHVVDTIGNMGTENNPVKVTIIASIICADNDNDGYGVCPDCGTVNGCTQDGGDCDDNNDKIKPGVVEDCNTSYDDNCNDQVNENCNKPSSCGNNKTEAGEACDKDDLNGYTCANVAAGFKSGQLKCKFDCSGYDSSLCVAGNTITAASCSQSDVQNAVNSAQDGDIVEVPAGACTWSIPLTFSGKNLLIKGAGIDNTIIIDNTASTWGQEPMWITGVAGKPFRITGFTFSGMQKRLSTEPAISIQGNSKNWRIDNCKFITTLDGRGIVAKGYGLIDNCIFENTKQGIAVHGEGSSSWQEPLSLGTANAIYIEDNYFSYSQPLDGALDAYNGARYVFRHNNVINTNIGHHGADSGGYRSTFSYERYLNVFSAPSASPWTVFGSRGGTGVDYDNTATGNYGVFSIVINYRTCNSYQPWGKCDGNNSYDGNTGISGYPCMDQIGRTTGQAISPVYEWNNTLNGVDGDIKVHDPWGCPMLYNHIKENRDYYNDVKRADYKAYTYPHPLTQLEPVQPDNTKPRVISFNVQPRSLSEGETATVSWSVSDNTALVRVELWIAPDVDGAPSGWSMAAEQLISGSTASGNFTNIPPTGIYWYGLHAIDAAGNIGNEQATIKVTVTAVGPVCGNINCETDLGEDCNSCPWDCGVCNDTTTTQISQHGITFKFDKAYKYGTFANGDYWVKGPVTITSITPVFTGSANGWEVNPLVGSQHGFDANCKHQYFKSSKVPSLPYTTSLPVESIVKVISSGLAQPCVKTAVVLTVVSKIPANNGTTVFRPPYVGIDKPFYNVGDLRIDLLPSLSPVGNPPALATVEGYFKFLRLEHLTSTALRDCRPSDAMQNYNPKNQPNNHETLLRLMLNDRIEDKKPALINYVQYGIDKVHAIMDGWVLSSADGHDPGHRVIAAFAATMLDITDAKIALNNTNGFHEDYYVFKGKSDISLWGEWSTDAQYWNYLMGLGGSRSRKDPYGYIDGGKCGTEYQLITVQSHKGSLLATHIMPSLQDAWNPSKWKIISNYADRWIETGVWSQPDPCAPFDGNIDNYGITFGPTNTNPSKCILDPDLSFYNSATDFGCADGKECGRFPSKHGTNADGGMYKSAFVEAMWTAYR